MVALRRGSTSVKQFAPPLEPGVYAIFLDSHATLPMVNPGADRLLYLGSGSILSERILETHFTDGKTDSSTLRRTIGAILKAELRLVAIPRSRDSDPDKFKFTNDGEMSLTNWMVRNLLASWYACRDFEKIEEELISQYKPPLNLDKWCNPDRERIKSLRKLCADEARSRDRI